MRSEIAKAFGKLTKEGQLQYNKACVAEAEANGGHGPTPKADATLIAGGFDHR